MTTDSDPIHIRRGELTDARLIAGFNEKMARETEAMTLDPEVISAGVLEMIRNEDMGFYLVAESGDRIVGSLMVTTEWSDWRNGVFWWIQSVYVIEEFRRQGVYNQLYCRVKEMGSEAGNVCGYRLYVEKENSIAQSTYQRLGMSGTCYDMYEELIPGWHYKL